MKKSPAWQMARVKRKSVVIQDAQKSKRTVHFSTLMDICHLKNSELELGFQKYEGRMVFRGDAVKDDSGSCAVLAEQGSSASKDGRRRNGCRSKALQGCAGQAADAVPAYTQVKMEDAPGLLKLPKSE